MSDHDYVLKTNRLGKTFYAKTGYRSLFRLLKRTLAGSLRPGDGVTALRDIHIDIYAGDTVGVIGSNGAGKTSLLRLLAGLYLPTEGEIAVKGQMALLPALGMGMVGELTVEENILLYGAICAVDRSVIKQNLQEIIEWAELEGFEKAELRTLSTGMRARAAFSTSRHITADITLMDEVLSAGDSNFRQKSKDVFRNFKDRGRTVIFASHDLDFVQSVCNKTLWLEKGRQKAFGDTEPVLRQYIDSQSTESSRHASAGERH